MTITLDTNNGPKNVLEREDYSTEAFICNDDGLLEPTVQKDTTISGNGSTANPLGVAISEDTPNALESLADGLFVTDLSTNVSNLEAGWVLVEDTWTYLSATTVTVPSNATLKYQVGDRIRLKQGGGYKYYYIIDVAATVITLWGGTDFIVANAVITDVYYSRADRPFAFPDYFTYAPTFVQTGTMTYTSTSIFVAKAKIQGKSLDFIVEATGTTGNVADAFISFQIPFNSASEESVNVARTDDGAGVFSNQVSLVKFETADTLGVALPGGGNWTLGAGRRFTAQGRVRLV